MNPHFYSWTCATCWREVSTLTAAALCLRCAARNYERYPRMSELQSAAILWYESREGRKEKRT